MYLDLTPKQEKKTKNKEFWLEQRVSNSRDSFGMSQNCNCNKTSMGFNTHFLPSTLPSLFFEQSHRSFRSKLA